MRKAAMCLLALLIPFTIFAQTANGIIKGKLIDSKSKEALEFVTVALIPKGSSTPTNGCSTDESGSFTITQIKAGVSPKHPEPVEGFSLTCMPNESLN